MEDTLPRKARENLRHREDILTAAVRLFSQKGFHTVSMQDIAKEAEFGVGTLYNFFDSKEQLFLELMRAGIDKVRQALVPILDSDLRQDRKLSEFIQAHADMIESNLEIVRLFISQYGTRSSVKLMLKDVSGDLASVVTEKLEAVIRAGIEDRVFRPVHADIAAIALRGALEAFVLDVSEGFDKAKTKDALSRVEEFFLTSLKRDASC